METPKSKQEKPLPPPLTSCRKSKKDDATFLEDLKDHIDEFINASMEEHKTCFKKTMQKVVPSVKRKPIHFLEFFIIQSNL